MINTIIFLISALGHEYIISLAMGQIGFFVLVSFAMQYGYIIGENYWLKKWGLEELSFGNYAFWVGTCILGFPILATVYYLSYIEQAYFRKYG